MLHFEIILDLPRKKQLQKNTQNFHIPFGELTQILTSHIAIVQLSSPGN